MFRPRCLLSMRPQLALLPAEQQKEIEPDPLLRLAVIREPALLRVEAPVVMRPENVVQILVVNHRLDEERRDVGGVQDGMDADLGGLVIVGAEADAAPALPRDLLAPSYRQRRDPEEIGPMHVGGE